MSTPGLFSDVRRPDLASYRADHIPPIYADRLSGGEDNGAIYIRRAR
ncbi:MAG TPA: hypothetical protein VF643_13860 [Sphingomonas sp.]